MNIRTGDARPLDGRGVLVTRPRAQASELIALLETAGARVVIAPAIRIAPPADPEPLRQAAADATHFDWIVFASANGVDAFLDALTAKGNRSNADLPTRLAGLPKVAAVGARTAERLTARGVNVAVVPREFTAEALVTSLTAKTTITGARVLLPRSEIGRDVIRDGLRAAGAIVTDVIAYRTVAEGGDDAAVVQTLLTRGRLDAVTFTSGSAVGNFVHLHGPRGIELLRNTVVAVIGPVTANAARGLGISVQVQPATFTTAAMVAALADYFTNSA